MQVQADLLGLAVTPNDFEEIGILGVAAMAVQAMGARCNWLTAKAILRPRCLTVNAVPRAKAGIRLSRIWRAKRP